MAASLLAKLPKKEKEQLLDDLNYLNMAEIKSSCERRSIPYKSPLKLKRYRRTCQAGRQVLAGERSTRLPALLPRDESRWDAKVGLALIFDITGSNLCTHLEIIELERSDLGAGITSPGLPTLLANRRY